MKYYSIEIPITWSGCSPAYKWCRCTFGDAKKKRTTHGECPLHWLSKKDYEAGKEIFYFDNQANATLFSLRWL